jgi:periplasmic copper chaperone A
MRQYAVTAPLRISAAAMLCALLSGGLSACTGNAPRTPLISVQGQRAVLSPALLGVGSVFLKIANAGRADDTLLSARASIPGTVVEIHDVRDGKMVTIEKLSIPSRGTVELKPNGLHIMIFKMPRSMKPGQQFTLFLTFEKSGEKQAPVAFTGPGVRHGRH